MSKGATNFTKDNEYYTPKYVIGYFGKFDYDPATTKEKATDLGIENYDTIETDGLKSDWTMYKRIWVNPPFTIKHLFFQKACDTFRKCGNEIYMLFPIEFLTTKRFKQMKIGGKLYVPSGRIKFQSGLGKKATSPAFGSVVFKIQATDEIEYIDLKELS